MTLEVRSIRSVVISLQSSSTGNSTTTDGTDLSSADLQYIFAGAIISLIIGPIMFIFVWSLYKRIYGERTNPIYQTSAVLPNESERTPVQEILAYTLTNDVGVIGERRLCFAEELIVSDVVLSISRWDRSSLEREREALAAATEQQRAERETLVFSEAVPVPVPHHEGDESHTG